LSRGQQIRRGRDPGHVRPGTSFVPRDIQWRGLPRFRCFCHRDKHPDNAVVPGLAWPMFAADKADSRGR
jgi:hypothetical protein